VRCNRQIANNFDDNFNALIELKKDMTAFTSAMLPTGARAITTFEELHSWASIVLSTANAKDRFVRTVGEGSEKTCTFGNFPDSEGIQRYQSVAIPKVDTTKLGSNLPDWKKILEVSDTAAASYLIG
jgi:hypothetical protein